MTAGYFIALFEIDLISTPLYFDNIKFFKWIFTQNHTFTLQNYLGTNIMISFFSISVIFSNIYFLNVLVIFLIFKLRIFSF